MTENAGERVAPALHSLSIVAANYGIAQAYVADVTPPRERSKAMGMVVGAAFGLGFILGPALGGVLSAQAGPRVNTL